MNENASGNRNRDSLLMHAEVSANGKAWVAKVRNISAGGLMAEPCCDLTLGDTIAIVLRNVGQVSGIVAWIDHSRFGIEFDQKIDQQAVRGSIGSTAPTMQTPRSSALRRL